MRVNVVVVVVVGFAAFLAAGCGGGASTVATKTVTVTATPSPNLDNLPAAQLPAPTSSSVAPSDTIPGEGTFRVGIDMQPGNYTSSPREAPMSCYGFRLRDLSGDPSANITAVEGDGPVYITIQPSDAGFKTQGCKTWQKVN
jgi:hypothetical protein